MSPRPRRRPEFDVSPRAPERNRDVVRPPGAGSDYRHGNRRLLFPGRGGRAQRGATPLRARRIVVVGTMASDPYAGMAWMHMQFAAGLRRLGHDVYYFETTSSWPYDPIQQARVCCSEYAVSYLARVAEKFGLADRWAYRRSYGDKAWFGLDRSRAEELLANADVVFSITGSTRLAEEGLEVGRLVYVCTDPVVHDVRFAQDDEDVRTLIEEHDDVVTFGLNIGNSDCSLPPLPHL